MIAAPHRLAAEAGAAALGEGGNAAEAMVAAAATIAVAYPHMNALGGDGFWILAAPGFVASFAPAGAPPAPSPSTSRASAAR